jgi:protein ImuA
MGNAFLHQQVSEPSRITRLLERIEPLVALGRRFSRTMSVSNEIDAGLPCRGLPLGCVHEVKSSGLACGMAFASMLAARISSPGGQMVYVAADRALHPLGLLPYGVKPERVIHVSVRSSLDLAWTVLEALRCPQVSAVLAVVKAADLTQCRRFQLAAEGSGATGFLLTDTASKPAIASVITRWQVSSLPAPPGAVFGEPWWAIDLAYCRGGHPGQWNTVWRNGQLEASSGTPGAKPVQRESRMPANRLAG